MGWRISKKTLCQYPLYFEWDMDDKTPMSLDIRKYINVLGN